MIEVQTKKDGTGKKDEGSPPNIPQRVYQARRQLFAGHAQAALDELSLLPNQGLALERLQSYASFSIVRGECFYALGNYKKAEQEFRIAAQASPNSPRIEILLELTRSLLEGQEILSLASSINRPTFGSGAPHPELTAAPTFARLFGEIEDVPKAATTFDIKAFEPARPTLHQKDSIEASSNEKEENAEEKEDVGIVSETLARIMVSQGKFGEARKVYIQLSRLHPELYEHYRARIAELEQVSQSSD